MKGGSGSFYLIPVGRSVHSSASFVKRERENEDNPYPQDYRRLSSMPAIQFAAGDPLEYNPNYSLLICRQCRYAIQKNALESHLLRHKIYRGDRQRLLSSIAHHHLLEPQHITLPAPGSPPIDSLPTLSGYRCTAVACQHLTVSSKRMKHHWSEIHGLGGSVPPPSSFARPVQLQTFFRGTKVRYFEVASPTASPVNIHDDGDDDDGDNGEDVQAGCEKKGHDPITAKPPSPLHVAPAPEITHGPPPTKFNLETLMYLHHFTTITSLTLPGANDTQPREQYWQMYVVSRALQLHWLMCGLLAISAHHLAALTDDTLTKRIHVERGEQFASEFSAGLGQRTGRDMDQEAAEIEDQAKRIGEQIRCLLHCAQSALVESTLTDQVMAPHQLLSIMTTLRGCVIPDPSLRYSGIRNDGHGRQQLSSVQEFLKLRNESHDLNPGPNSSNDNKLSVLLDVLRALPCRMAEVFGRPESAKDVLATLSAITALAECCEISFASDEAGAAWQGVTTWLAHVPDHLNQMVARDDRAALVVLAHWAAILVKRAEHVGCWLLNGLAKIIVLQITRRLSLHGHTVLDLVECLMDMVNG